ncbi:outer membrane lipocarrier protein LolA [Candidatus Blochmanniella vafra str. BVAF]|uniref:Outer-membrane lipoprotein carrier protein n=2 Tax=Candidatus Blochmanniella vafra TaxID=251535 RepID=E8Q687_BLOVB|nr:outer membrane lipocarrier protein LolA [Candidatus Blochmannia vafer str. BVAF]
MVTNKFHGIGKLIVHICFSMFMLQSIQTQVISSSSVLQNRLNLVNKFYVNFIQKVYFFDYEENIEIARGELWVKRPNLFRWHFTDPEEFVLVSDGQTVWFYVPKLKQVVAYCLKNQIAGNIFLELLFSSNLFVYQNYIILQKEDWFYLKSMHDNSLHIKECAIQINKDGVINQINVEEENGQRVNYYLSNQCVNFIDKDKFNFFISKDMQLDDQRR